MLPITYAYAPKSVNSACRGAIVAAHHARQTTENISDPYVNTFIALSARWVVEDGASGLLSRDYSRFQRRWQFRITPVTGKHHMTDALW